ncbi:uncharacterized protein LOC141908571 [Tubulanus polymorphus]|uniref:uncharacterized protein LOC141908571 n=1 Tax=Tubulanus polymorphus TaxID=672921 RepID=UPI003DA4D3AA
MNNSTEEIGVMLVVYGAPFVLLFGIVGNTLIIVTFSGKRLRYKSYAWLFICLSVSDSGFLATSLVRRWAFFYYRLEYDFCVVHVYLTYLFLHASPWMLVLITIERCVSVVAPMRASRKRMIYASLAVIFIVLAINSHMFYGIRIGNDLVIASAAPFAVLLVCNVVIIYFLKRAESRRQTQTSAVNNTSKNQHHHLNVATNFIFVVTSFPFSVVLQLDLNQVSILAHAILAMLMYLNYAINFWLYCFTGRKFREELMILCGFCSRKNRGPTAYSTTSLELGESSVRF